MSGLTWDNIDDWIAGIPKDDQGHFINNQNRDPIEVTVGDHTIRFGNLVEADPAHGYKKGTQSVALDVNYGSHLPPASEYDIALRTEIPQVAKTAQAGLVALGAIAIAAAAETKEDLVEQFGTAQKIDKDLAEQHYDPLARAKAGLATLDTTAAEQEMVEHGEALAKVKAMNDAGMGGVLASPLGQPMTPAKLQEHHKASVDRAKLIVAEMDSILETGGRVTVSEKQLFNCSADLNQLIPFKYRLPWELYLKGCEHHWMPAEHDLRPLADVYAHVPDNLKLLIARMRYTFKSGEYLFNPGILLNIYSKITNPECRQYILRQAMEHATLNHAWMDIEGTLKIKEFLIKGNPAYLALAKDNDAFKYRYEAVKKHTAILDAPDLSTESPEELAEFLKAFIVIYGYVNFIMPVLSYYQVLVITEQLPAFVNLNAILWKLIRDLMVQFEFAKFFVATSLAENPAVNTGEFKTKVLKALKSLIDVELDLVSTITSGQHIFAETHTVAYTFMEEIYGCVDPLHVTAKRMSHNQEGLNFIAKARELMDSVKHNSAQGSIADSFD